MFVTYSHPSELKVPEKQRQVQSFSTRQKKGQTLAEGEEWQ